MKLSDAIALGRTLISHPNPLSWCDCAIGMGVAAIGKHDNLPYKVINEAFREWPWLRNTIQPNGKVEYSTQISYYFHDVCNGLMTLDQLIDYVRSVEPPEPDDAATQPAEVREPVTQLVE